MGNSGTGAYVDNVRVEYNRVVGTAGPTVSGITTDGATISWTTDENSSTIVLYSTTSYADTVPEHNVLSNYGSQVTGASGTSHSVTLTNLNPGTTYFFRAVSRLANYRQYISAQGSFTTTSCSRSPYPGPGRFTVAGSGDSRLQAENYDNGGPNCAYFDADTPNNGGAYRSDRVDLIGTGDADGASNVKLGWTAAGEWLRYQVNVAAAGNYVIRMRVSAPSQVNNAYRIRMTGVDFQGTVPGTGSYETFTTVIHTATLTAGNQDLQVDIQAGGWDWNWIEFRRLPTIDEVSVSSSALEANDSTQYTVTIRATEPTGVGNIMDMRVMFHNNDGLNFNQSQARGYLSWGSTAANATWAINNPASAMSASGGGFWTYDTAEWGATTYITPVSCSTSTSGNQRTVTFTFRAKHAWAGGVGQDVRGWVRVIPDSPYGSGWLNFTTDFNVHPAPPTGGSATANSPSQITWGWTVASPNTLVYRVYNAASGGSLLHTSAANASSWAESGLSPNTQYQRWVASHINGLDSLSRLALPARFTHANTPGAASTFSVGTSSLMFSFGINNNPASTQFAIQETSTGKFLTEPTGSPPASQATSNSEVWRNISEWGSAFAVTGLSPNTVYNFRVKARNAENVETAYGSTASIRTLAAEYVPAVNLTSHWRENWVAPVAQNFVSSGVGPATSIPKYRAAVNANTGHLFTNEPIQTGTTVSLTPVLGRNNLHVISLNSDDAGSFRIQAEAYTPTPGFGVCSGSPPGTAGTDYNDADGVNSFGDTFRNPTGGVDIGSTGDTDGGCNRKIGFVAAGEWQRYSFPFPGNWHVGVRWAPGPSGGSGGVAQWQVDSQAATTTTLSGSGNYETFFNSTPVALIAGTNPQFMRYTVNTITASGYDYNWYEVYRQISLPFGADNNIRAISNGGLEVFTSGVPNGWTPAVAGLTGSATPTFAPATHSGVLNGFFTDASLNLSTSALEIGNIDDAPPSINTGWGSAGIKQQITGCTVGNIYMFLGYMVTGDITRTPVNNISGARQRLYYAIGIHKTGSMTDIITGNEWTNIGNASWFAPDTWHINHIRTINTNGGLNRATAAFPAEATTISLWAGVNVRGLGFTDATYDERFYLDSLRLYEFSNPVQTSLQNPGFEGGFTQLRNLPDEIPTGWLPAGGDFGQTGSTSTGDVPINDVDNTVFNSGSNSLRLFNRRHCMFDKGVIQRHQAASGDLVAAGAFCRTSNVNTDGPWNAGGYVGIDRSGNSDLFNNVGVSTVYSGASNPGSTWTFVQTQTVASASAVTVMLRGVDGEGGPEFPTVWFDDVSFVRVTPNPLPNTNCTDGNVVLTNQTGFGGTSADSFRYTWQPSGSYTWTNTETPWTSGTLSSRPPTNVSGDYWLHLRAYKGANVLGTWAVGPYRFNPATPVNPGALNNPICSGSSTQLTAGVNSGEVVDWYTGSCGGTFVGTGSPSVNPTSSTTYFARARNSAVGCVSTSCASFTLNVVNPANAGLTVGVATSPICAGSSTNITVAGSENGVSYQLRLHPSNTNVGSPVTGNGGTINLPTGTLTSTTTFNVLATRTPCAGVQLTQTATVTVSQPPTTADAGSDQSVCDGGQITLAGNTPVHGSGQWTIQSGGTGTFGNASSPTSTFTHTGGSGPIVLRWTISNAPCTPSFDEMSITVNPRPSTPANVQAEPPYVGAGDSTTLTASVSGAVIDWYTGSCGGTFVGTGNSIVVSPGSTTTYYARARIAATGCVSSNCQAITINWYPTPNPVITAWRTSFTHGSAGTYTITIDPDPPVNVGPVVEPRRWTSTNGRIVLDFNSPIEAVDGNLGANDVVVTDSQYNSYTVTGISASNNNTRLTINTGNLPNGRRYRFDFTGKLRRIGDSPPRLLTGRRFFELRYLVGDVFPAGTPDLEVDVSDYGLIKTYNRQAVNSSTFRLDINADGSINLIDAALAKSMHGLTVP